MPSPIIFWLSDFLDQIILCVPCDADVSLTRSTLLYSHSRAYVRAFVCQCGDVSWGRTLLTLRQVDTSTCRHVRIDGYKLNLLYHVLAIHDIETSICCTIIERAARRRSDREILKKKLKRDIHTALNMLWSCNDSIQSRVPTTTHFYYFLFSLYPPKQLLSYMWQSVYNFKRKHRSRWIIFILYGISYNETIFILNYWNYSMIIYGNLAPP